MQRFGKRNAIACRILFLTVVVSFLRICNAGWISRPIKLPFSSNHSELRRMDLSAHVSRCRRFLTIGAGGGERNHIKSSHRNKSDQYYSCVTPLWQLKQQPSSPVSDEEHHNSMSWMKAINRRLTDVFQLSISRTDSNDKVVLTAGLFGNVRKMHNPITYFVLGIFAGFRWEWCFRNPIYWFAIGFLVKWYRARYVYKIPVWDRQPNWNNVVTSKEQEKELKAVTCRNCGSTIFIAKTREFFFEGRTGIGGLGCFACGAKGKDNFYENREEIVEDVGDMDDYFEYERPLDFVSRAERKSLLKEAQGDEDQANQILLERNAALEGRSVEKKESSQSLETTDAVVVESAKTVEGSPAIGNMEYIEKKNDTDNTVKLTEPIKKEAKETNQDIEGSHETESISTINEMDETHNGHVHLHNGDKTEPETINVSEPDAGLEPKSFRSPSFQTRGVDLDGLEALDMDSF